MKTGLRIGGVFLLSALTLFVACKEKATIGQVLSDPQRYADREVGVEGNVIQNYSVLGRGAYQIEDGTGRLWVVSEKGVPRKGARVRVKGKVREGFDLGSLVKLPDVVGSALVLIESAHEVKAAAPQAKGEGQKP
ncbi:MAG: hypothetical protein A3F84_23880 [Candidatus Handelsmanbacteria bacterium RIFCSPLOWO2_12_FULL_64_10]|uniref:Bacterial OB-fold domain-containing protein n=1 Tax=Handelsmanbacteria sp. (strain RIFCSPLOWO2_12_FULL_64_10) TaxID=1817868 RepID=A0A1F6D2I9_HANXR|nr:MAG: hypothetical protein A3F84_23880 [Candidatus Handelsmanbacteria bacterium RIFCSPLOWO2_12_FULL_64_10]